jgi:hypothetical protein
MPDRDIGQTIRQPSVANLMVDSTDRDFARFPSPWDFQITKNQSMFNGFFTRIATTEVVVDWNLPNISDVNGNRSLLFLVTGTYAGLLRVDLDEGFYTVAQALEAIVANLNGQTAPAVFTIYQAFAVTGIGYNNGDITSITSPVAAPNLVNQLNFAVVGFGTPTVDVNSPDIRGVRYIDFVSSELTYVQEVKDATTAQTDRNVLCRFYFAFDTPVPTDIYGFPILMGYEAFNLRRIFNPAKQIKWDPNLPIGNITFQVYDSNNQIVDEANVVSPPLYKRGGFLMTLQISEN